MSGLRFRCGALEYDPTQHRWAWGARLIFEEVIKYGQSGIVGDRQSFVGEQPTEAQQADGQKAFDLLLAYVRGTYPDSGSREVWEQDYRTELGVIRTVASPQASYGYLYVTQVLIPNSVYESSEVTA